MPQSPDTRWLPAHIFFNAHIYTVECDRVILDLCEPFLRRCQAEGWIDAHFFIRYSELGPHVRFRVHGRADVLEGTVWPALEAHVRSLYPEVKFETPDGTQVGEGTEMDGRVTHVAEIEYEPETERYGGPDGVLLAERYFQVSSEAAYALLHKTGTERSSRLGKGLLGMVVLVHAFADDRAHATDFAQQYGINYLRSLVRDEESRGAWLGAFGSGYDQQAETLTQYVDEVWERLDEGEELSEALDAWRDGLAVIRDEFRALLDGGRLLMRGDTPFTDWKLAVQSVVSSYVHMMNNRLGISLQEESYLAYLIMRAMGRPADAVTL
jgi:thiopeptide-type bacteriocin biosynthesis protein